MLLLWLVVLLVPTPAPNGRYVTLEYDSSFENKKEATENVIREKDKDGKFCVAGYFIK